MAINSGGWFLLLTVLALGQGSTSTCQVDPKLIAEIHSYQPIVDQIAAAVLNGAYKGKVYEDLADYVDQYPHRLSGSDELENAIDNAIERLTNANLSVSTHDVLVPKWVRGEESAEIILPRRQKLTMLGIGNSLGTPKEGITAEVLVVKDFAELEAKKDQVPGKIVLYNPDYVDYATTSDYRRTGPSKASALGAVAVLIRSITPFSINSPHTGYTAFDSEELQIPVAAISVENSHLIARFTERGSQVLVNLKMEAQSYPPRLSRNVIGDITGSSKSSEYVVISGHIDNWDVGQGAMDDAGGAFLAWHSLALINLLNLPTSARTLRSILWTCEEFGAVGAVVYRNERENEIRNWSAAFESDVGVYKARGIEFAGSDEAACIMQEISSMFENLNATELIRLPVVGSDISATQDLGVPLGDLYLEENNYFWSHHSNADWMDVINSDDLDQNLAIYAATTYILADLSISLPKMQPTSKKS